MEDVTHSHGPKETANESETLLVTIVEASRLLSLSRSKVYELLYAGSLTSVRIGGARRVRRSDLEEFVRELRQAS